MIGNKDETVIQNVLQVLNDECDDESQINYWLGPENNNPTGFFRLDIGGYITILKVLLKNSHNGAHQNR